VKSFKKWQGSFGSCKFFSSGYGQKKSGARFKFVIIDWSLQAISGF